MQHHTWIAMLSSFVLRPIAKGQAPLLYRCLMVAAVHVQVTRSSYQVAQVPVQSLLPTGRAIKTKTTEICCIAWYEYPALLDETMHTSPRKTVYGLLHACCP
jgi:hypothetical protein